MKYPGLVVKQIIRCHSLSKGCSRKQLDQLNDEWFFKTNSTYSLQTGIILQFWSHFTFANTIINEYTKLTYLNNTKFCDHPFTDFSILEGGRCVPCCLNYDGELYIGDANRDSLEPILIGAKASHFRKIFLGEGSLPEYCRKCQEDLTWFMTPFLC
jgi:hypothetical protein